MKKFITATLIAATFVLLPTVANADTSRTNPPKCSPNTICEPPPVCYEKSRNCYFV